MDSGTIRSDKGREYREKLGRVLATQDDGEFDEMIPEYQDLYMSNAEAVAAQVFRDFWRYLNSRPVSSDLEYAADNRAQKAITQWAAACGIDLKEEG